MSVSRQASEPGIVAMMEEIGVAARKVAGELARVPGEQKNAALLSAAQRIRDRKAEILEANAGDMSAAKARQLNAAMLDRLLLDDGRVEAMAGGIEEIAALDNPIGQTMAEWDRPNGLHIQRVRVPLGVIGIIYESRPNVTADAGCLCLKSGNAVILRGGSESYHSSATSVGLPRAAIQMVPTTSRDAVGLMLSGLDGCRTGWLH
jgi:glutamate-5-semialdehyde dehydrogenase